MNTRKNFDIDKLNASLMNIPVDRKIDMFDTDLERYAYKVGHQHARHAAVEVVREHAKSFRIRSWYVPGMSAYYVTKDTIPEHLKESAIALYELEGQ
jgi:hypothetical protein